MCSPALLLSQFVPHHFQIIGANFLSPFFVYRLGLFYELIPVFQREGIEGDAAGLGSLNLLCLLLLSQRTSNGTFLFNCIEEDLAKVLREFVQPACVGEVNIKALSIVELGVILRYIEFATDVANDRRVVKAGNDPRL